MVRAEKNFAQVFLIKYFLNYFFILTKFGFKLFQHLNAERVLVFYQLKHTLIGKTLTPAYMVGRPFSDSYVGKQSQTRRYMLFDNYLVVNLLSFLDKVNRLVSSYLR